MTNAKNPLMAVWTTPHSVPPFDEIRPEHFEEAIDEALEDNLKTIGVIASQTENPDFKNTIEAIENADRDFKRIFHQRKL